MTDDAELVWHENTDGLGNLRRPAGHCHRGPWHIFSIYTADLDGDGDRDVLSASPNWDDTIAWYENSDGLGNFEEPSMSLRLRGSMAAVVPPRRRPRRGWRPGCPARLPTADDTIAWYENTAGLRELRSRTDHR